MRRGRRRARPGWTANSRISCSALAASMEALARSSCLRGARLPLRQLRVAHSLQAAVRSATAWCRSGVETWVVLPLLLLLPPLLLLLPTAAARVWWLLFSSTRRDAVQELRPKSCSEVASSPARVSGVMSRV